MRDQRDMMIEKQAQLISTYRSNISKLEAERDRLKNEIDSLHRPAKFYLELQKQVGENPIVQAEWDRFLLVLKMAADDDYLRENGAFT